MKHHSAMPPNNLYFVFNFLDDTVTLSMLAAIKIIHLTALSIQHYIANCCKRHIFFIALFRHSQMFPVQVSILMI